MAPVFPASAEQAQIGMQRVRHALTDARERYLRRRPKSASLHERACRSMPGGNTRSALYWDPFPFYVERSHGCRLCDVDGHEYLDVLGEYTAGIYGHSEPVILDAIANTVERGYSNGAPAQSEILLAELLCSRFPSVGRVRFCNSGTEANLYALTLARCATGRSKLLCFSGAYHGGVFVFANGGNPMNAPFDWTVARYNDIAGTQQLIRELGTSLAAVIVEPMMSNGGCIPADPHFLRMLREACSAVGAQLIFDEIVTSRMGSGGLQKIAGVSPDLTTFGKFLGAGFSSGAFGGRAELMDRMNPARVDALPHAGTFNNNVYSMSVGHKALSAVFTPQRGETLQADGDELRERLNEIASRISPAVQFTGCGSIMNVHFHRGAIRSPEDLASEPRELVRLLHFDLLEMGIYAAARGQINLSLPMGTTEFDAIAQALDACLRQRAELINSVC